jgi:hypothetical protein
MSFRIGQEVVYVGPCLNPTMIAPKEGSVVQIASIGPICDCGCGLRSYGLKGFERIWVINQWFVSDNLRPLDEVLNEISIEEVFNNPIKEVV